MPRHNPEPLTESPDDIVWFWNIRTTRARRTQLDKARKKRKHVKKAAVERMMELYLADSREPAKQVSDA